VLTPTPLPPLLPELAPVLAPTLVPLTVPGLRPLLTATLLPLPLTPLARPPQAAMTSSTNAGNDRERWLGSDGAITARGLSHQTGRLTCGYRKAKRPPSTSVLICHEICHAEPSNAARHLPTPLSKRRYFPTISDFTDENGSA